MIVTGGRAVASTKQGLPRDSVYGGGRQALSVLVVDDEPGIRDFLQRALAKEYGLVETAASAEEAEQLRRRCHFDLLIVDICLPGTSGVEWMQEVASHGCASDVIFMTAFADLDKVIDALRVGASDFILKPFRLEQMLTSVRRCMERRKLARENFVLRRQVDAIYTTEGMVGNSEAVREIGQLIARVAPTPSVVLIEGESGTGKELVANAIHKLSKRSGSFVPVNCGAIAPDLIESELFGHIKGSFTGAQQTREGLFSYADGGTLFLDEIGEMPLLMQAKLLRALEERRIRPVGSERELPVNVRVIAATNRNLEEEVAEGRFREDLFYRLNVLCLRVPPLRERREDIALLVHHFSRHLAESLGLPEIPFSHEDLRQLEAYEWPGNVRELRNMMERCLLLGRLPAEYLASEAAAGEAGQTRGYPTEWSLDEVEKEHILQVLADMEGNKTQAARQLGVARKTLDRKLQAWRGAEDEPDAPDCDRKAAGG
ncbi:sigma-54 dependent transcriptional regulator [Motiliproteus sp. SC1-56]|uniref:sigma-54-dependent transcriptional regulator n=1 Tax=Motiliproteus sp. SC1-56 TaxID=2799565 RepID=UPI001A8E6261|nr:sigma-54 dependent transcriptional regulator [Motiliproteus sp. SC1-56]